MAINAAVVGLGVGEQHALAFARDPRCQLKWIYDSDAQRSARVLKNLQCQFPNGPTTRIAVSYGQILEDQNVDVVSIATYDECHFEQILSAREANKHVFCEKPLCQTYDQLQALKASWARSPVRHLASNLVLRAAPLYRWLRKAIQLGELGRVYAYDGDYLYGRLSKITEGWRKDTPNYAVLEGGGVHLIDLMFYLTGERPVAVSAVGNRICTASTSFQYNDFVSATYTFESTLVARITANFGCVHRHQHVVRVFGTEATFIYDDQGSRLHRSREPSCPAETIDLAPLASTKGDLISEFVDRVAEGPPFAEHPLVDFDVLAACIAGNDAAVSGQSGPIRYAE